MADPKGVTERESYIIAQALYEFIRLEQSKPRDLRRWSDEQHAVAILHARFESRYFREQQLQRLVVLFDL
mgnify:CR=1 FL=1